MNNSTESTVIIEPRRGLFHLDLRAIWHYRELLYFLVWRDLKVRYKQTVIGIGWAVLQPVITMIIFTAVFGGLVKMPSDGLPYPIFFYSALLPWNYFAGALQRCVASVVGSARPLDFGHWSAHKLEQMSEYQLRHGEAVAIGIAITLSGKLGLRVLYFVTLVPVVLAVAALLKIGAPVADELLSARPVAQQLGSMEIKPLPVAVLGVRRETEYGLEFYRNQRISRYERRQVPLDEHLLLAPEGARGAIPQFVGTRRVAYLGGFPPQHLEFYWVAAATPAK
jgi:hypothetical protein